MASKNIRHAYTVIGLAHGIADNLELAHKGRPRNKTVINFVRQTRERCQDCFNLWPDRITPEEKAKIEARMQVIEDIATTDNKHDVSVLTSLALGLLNDLHDQMTKPKKQETLNRLMTTYNRMHRHWDRHLDKWTAYDLANHAIKKINEIPA